MLRIASLRPARIKPRQRYRIRVVVGQVGGRDFLDGELDPGQLGLPAGLKLPDSLEDQIVEALCPVR